MGAIGRIVDNQTDFLPERFASGGKFVGRSIGRINVRLAHPAFIRIGKVNLAVPGLWAASFADTCSFIYVVKAPRWSEDGLSARIRFP